MKYTLITVLMLIGIMSCNNDDINFPDENPPVTEQPVDTLPDKYPDWMVGKYTSWTMPATDTLVITSYHISQHIWAQYLNPELHGHYDMPFNVDEYVQETEYFYKFQHGDKTFIFHNYVGSEDINFKMIYQGIEYNFAAYNRVPPQ